MSLISHWNKVIPAPGKLSIMSSPIFTWIEIEINIAGYEKREHI